MMSWRGKLTNQICQSVPNVRTPLGIWRGRRSQPFWLLDTHRGVILFLCVLVTHRIGYILVPDDSQENGIFR